VLVLLLVIEAIDSIIRTITSKSTSASRHIYAS
jgi:hypothetical protein